MQQCDCFTISSERGFWLFLVLFRAYGTSHLIDPSFGSWLSILRQQEIFCLTSCYVISQKRNILPNILETKELDVEVACAEMNSIFDWGSVSGFLGCKQRFPSGCFRQKGICWIDRSSCGRRSYRQASERTQTCTSVFSIRESDSKEGNTGGRSGVG